MHAFGYGAFLETSWIEPDPFDLQAWVEDSSHHNFNRSLVWNTSQGDTSDMTPDISAQAQDTYPQYKDHFAEAL